MLPFSLFIPVICYVILIYEKPPTRWMIYTLINATKSEITEFSEGLWYWKLLFFFLPGLLWFLTLKINQNYLNASPAFKRRFLYLFLGFLLISYSFKAYQQETIKVVPKVVFRTTFKDTPVYTLIRFNKAIRVEKNRYSESDIPFINTSIDSSYQQQFYLLIIGESSRYANWQINGYQRETSPLLYHKENLISFTDVISPGHITNISLPVILSSAGLHNLYDSTHLSILSVLNSSGFITNWISNQRYSKNSVAEIARQSDYFKEIDNNSEYRFDGVLLDELRSLLHERDDKQFVVMHLRGSHYPYHNRYPDGFNRFQPSMKKNKHIIRDDKHREKLVNSYDNSILYSDYILNSAIELVKNNRDYGFVVFISDHGEVLFNNSKNGFGRGLDSFSPELFHIPFFIWTTEEFRCSNDGLYKKVIDNINESHSAENLPPTLFELMGIQLPDFGEKESLFVKKTSRSERLIQYNNKIIDYDKMVEK